MNKYDYQNATNRELAAWMRQYRRNRFAASCEFGHTDCGCTSAPSMNQLAPCSIEVVKEMQRRKENA